MFGVRLENELVERIVHGLLHPESPVCYNLVVPPGFGEDRLAEVLAAKLKNHPQNPLVAIISADQIRNVDSYACELFDQWNACGAGLPSAPPNTAANRITQFFDLIPKGRPAIQILTRFHRILDVFDASFLGDLRDRERAYLVRSVCISPHGYDELRQRWRQRGHFFCNSDYGWTHHVELVEPVDLDVAVKAAASLDVPEYLAKLIAGWTGNYPEPFVTVANCWIRMGRPNPTTKVQLELRREAQKSLRRFVKWIDPGETSTYRDAVLALEVDPNEQESILRLNRHPWKGVFLKNNRVRADQLAAAIVAEYLLPAGEKTLNKIGDIDLWTKGAALYRGWKFALSQRLLDIRCESGGLPGYLALLALHSQIMAEVYGGEAEASMTDCNWETACNALRKARTQIDGLRLGQENSERLIDRYEEFLKFCDKVQKARTDNSRIVDVLLGIKGDNGNADRRAAFTLLAAHHAYDSRIPGDTLACQAALPLLEQIFRAWAFVALGLNYYAAPPGCESVWAKVAPCFDGIVRKPDPGTEFSSFECFAYFAFILHEESHPDAQLLRPEPDLKALERSLSVLELRRDLAHALSVVNPKLRRNYFEITDRWLKALFHCDLTIGTRDELLAAIEPLQLISPEDYLA